MLTPEEGTALHAIAGTGFAVEELTFLPTGAWAIRATSPTLDSLTRHGTTRLDAITGLRRAAESARTLADGGLPVRPAS